jgi:tRNA (adenine57-N1/adenine58-N1)-methyltransferase catalytic subunit
LLDIHPTVPGADVDGKLEIFEAGTGHGALTLHLAKAIHGANTAAPAIPGSTQETDDDHPSNQDLEKQDIYEAWRSNRRAIIHTLDVSAKHSSHAQQVVKNFRDGVYFPHIDFHVGNIDTYLTSRLLQTNEEPFLEHAILDLPNTHENLDIVGKALKPNGTLITFCPSITQINACVMHVKEKKIPFFLDNVLELGGGVGVGGREWDVRPVKPRAAVKAQPVRDGLVNADGVEGDNGDVMENPQELGTLDGGWEMVCRPKVGVRTAGGGFVGVWRRMVIADS